MPENSATSSRSLRKRNRRSFSLADLNSDMVCQHASRLDVSDNAALNVLLDELRLRRRLDKEHKG